MLILIILALLNIGALYFLLVSKSLGIKWMAALYCLFFTLVGGWIWTGLLSKGNHLRSLHISGYNYIFSAYSLLAAACLSVIVSGVRKERIGFIVLGFIVLAVTIFIMWLGYELIHTSWKIGG
jgi:hypothetical protein